MNQDNHVKAFKLNAKQDFKAGAIKPQWSGGLQEHFLHADNRKAWAEITAHEFGFHL